MAASFAFHGSADAVVQPPGDVLVGGLIGWNTQAGLREAGLVDTDIEALICGERRPRRSG